MDQKIEKIAMRDVFIEKIHQRMHEDKSLFFISADFGSPKLDMLRADYKDRFINIGIAEQNLINVSTGLAIEGFTVYAYAIAPFLTMRAFEQIRNNLSLLSQIKKVNVNLVGVGAGLSYDLSGPTHHCLEDLSILRTLPNIEIFSPSDALLAESFVDYSIEVKKPKYIRFDSKILPNIYQKKQKPSFKKGFFEFISGDKICLITTGYMTHTGIKVANKIKQAGINIGLIDVFMLRPLNKNLFLKVINKYRRIVTIEEAFTERGGLDSLISAILQENDSSISLTRIGLKDTYSFEMGGRDRLHKLNGLDDQSIIRKIRRFLDRI